MNRRIFALSGALALAVMALFSCQKQEDETIPVLKLSTSLIPAKGGSVSLEVAATSSWTLTLTPSSASSWLHLSQSSGQAGVFNLQATVDANEGTDHRAVTLTLSGPTLKTEALLSQMSGKSGTAPAWLELPALNNPSYVFITHDWDGGRYVNKESSPQRNYSLYWDPDNYVSHWVAYPLNAKLLEGGYGRYDNKGGGFPPDPALTELGMRQPELWDHSYGGGWTRGHQIPSADRQVEKANISTFYVSNMTPQQYDFNGGIWGNLEGRVRTYAKSSDTLYVVTGCHITNDSGWSGDRGGMCVRVPSAYYKALLRKKGSAYSAMAFYLPHSQSIASGSFSDYAISVTELEKKVGLDFFATLPVVVGNEEAARIEGTIAKW